MTLNIAFQTRHHLANPDDEQVYNFGLFLMDKILNQAGKALTDFRDMPQVTGDWEQLVGNRFIAEQMDYNPETELAKAAEKISKLNPEQKLVHDEILASVLRTDAQGRPQGKIFFVNGLGKCGKSFTWNTIASSCTGHSLIVLRVAPAGIAALILTGGWTSHSVLGIPIVG